MSCTLIPRLISSLHAREDLGTRVHEPVYCSWLGPCVSNAHLLLSTQLALVRHYSILEFPSMVVEVRKDDYHIVAG